MKMKKRLLSLGLVFVFIMSSLIGCGSKGASASATLTDTMKQMSEMKTGTFNYSFGLTSTEKMIKELDGAVDETMKQFVIDLIQAEYQIQGTVESMSPMTMSFKLSMKKSGTDKATPVTTVLFKDDTYYINMAELREFLNNFNNPMLAAFGGMLTTQEDYMKVTLDDLNQLAGLTGEDAITSISADMDELSKYTESITSFQNMIFENFENAVKDVNPPVVSNKDGNVVIQINTGNYEAAITKVCEDIIKNKETYLDQFISTFENIDSMKIYVEDAKKDKKATLDNMQMYCERIISQLKENKLADTDGLDFKWETSVTGGEGSREANTNLSFYLKSGESDMEVGMFMKGTTKEKIADKVTVPEKNVSLQDFMKSLGQ